MSIDNPWFSDRFANEDYTTVEVFRRGGVGYRTRHFEPLMLCPGGTVWQPDQVWTLGTLGCQKGVTFYWIEFRTARWEFLERVYVEAVAATKQRFPDLFNVRWIPCLQNWRELVVPECYADAADFLEEQIRRVAARGNVDVHTGIQLRTRPSHQESVTTERAETTIRLVIDVERLSESLTRSIMDRCRAGADIEVPERRRTFAADQIADLAVRPTCRQLELLNHWEATPPASDLEKEMIRAAGRLDIDQVERLVDAGANVNALDDSDETALTAASMTFRVGDSTRRRVVQRLIDRGADVNLFGYDGVDPLVAATLSAEPRLVDILLRAGADPNHNPYPEDEPKLISAALDFAATDALIDRSTPAGDASEEIVRLLENAGAVIGRT